MKYRFIDEEKSHHAVSRMAASCQAAGASYTTFGDTNKAGQAQARCLTSAEEAHRINQYTVIMTYVCTLGHGSSLCVESTASFRKSTP